MLYQDILFKPKQFPLHATARLAYFNTDDFNSAIYAYENDLTHQFSIPAYSDSGFRFYLNAQYKWNRHLTTELRLAKTWYTNKTTISSGLDQIDGSTATDIKAQVIWNFGTD